MAIPAHIAIIMDGNGRWAMQRGLPRNAGHRVGVEALRQTVRTCGEVGVKYLTVFAFSSENWSRPQTEITELMGLLKLFIRKDLAELHKNGVRVRVIGERQSLKPDILALLVEAEQLTMDNRNLDLIIAFNYGARDEMVRAIGKLAGMVGRGELRPEGITDEMISSHLDTAGIPDPELIIRTSGEQRLSNFLLWQAAYSEFVFLPCYWPDFSRDDLMAAIAEYEARDRRFGGLAAQAVAT
ncbi:MAG: isoprenyl transferase [Rhizobiaceae bacterium]